VDLGARVVASAARRLAMPVLPAVHDVQQQPPAERSRCRAHLTILLDMMEQIKNYVKSTKSARITASSERPLERTAPPTGWRPRQSPSWRFLAQRSDVPLFRRAVLERAVVTIVRLHVAPVRLTITVRVRLYVAVPIVAVSLVFIGARSKSQECGNTKHTGNSHGTWHSDPPVHGCRYRQRTRHGGPLTQSTAQAISYNWTKVQ